jgi:hypothetical protein
MQNIYRGMWALIGVAILALIDFRLPEHGFRWVQSSDLWQAGRMAVMYALLPYLLLRLFEIVIVAKNYGQVGNMTTEIGDFQQVTAEPTTELAPPQQDQQPHLANPQPVPLLVDDLPSWDIGNITPARGNPVPTTDIDHDLSQAVMLYAQWGSYAKAATRLGGKITGEGIRQRVISAYQKDPQWVMQVLPYDKLPKI